MRTGTVWPKIGRSGAPHGVRAWQSTSKHNKQEGLEERKLCCVGNVGCGSGKRVTRHDTSVLWREVGQCAGPCSAKAVGGGFGAEVAWQCIAVGERGQKTTTVEPPRPPRAEWSAKGAPEPSAG